MKLTGLPAAVTTTLILGLAAAGCGATPQAGVLRTSQSYSAPSMPAPSCKTSLNELSQSLDGTIDGCYQVPAYAPGAYTFSLESLLSKVPAATLKDPSSRSSTNPLRLTLSPASGPPGTRVTIHSRFASESLPPGTRVDQQFTTVCWDGCASGLQDGAEPIKVRPGGTFTTTFDVPKTAWLEADGPHPLVSGHYQVGILCLVSIEGGCGGGQAETTFTLHASRLRGA